MKDVLYQLYVRKANVQEALKLRQEAIAEKRQRPAPSGRLAGMDENPYKSPTRQRAAPSRVWTCLLLAIAGIVMLALAAVTLLLAWDMIP